MNHRHGQQRRSRTKRARRSRIYAAEQSDLSWWSPGVRPAQGWASRATLVTTDEGFLTKRPAPKQRISHLYVRAVVRIGVFAKAYAIEDFEMCVRCATRLHASIDATSALRKSRAGWRVVQSYVLRCREANVTGILRELSRFREKPRYILKVHSIDSTLCVPRW